jgi:predicted DNA-binding transcriptional regulator YafY
VAWDIDREAWRTFRVDRIEPRLPLGARFTPRPLPDEDVAAYVARGVTGSGWGFRAQVIVRAPADAVRERIGPWIGTVESIDERSCLLDAGASSPEMMAVYLGLLDADFTVTEPPELIDHLRRLAERYRGSTAA